MMYVHDFDLIFSIQSDNHDPMEIDPDIIRQACIDRINSVTNEEIFDAVGHVETYVLDNTGA